MPRPGLKPIGKTFNDKYYYYSVFPKTNSAVDHSEIFAQYYSNYTAIYISVTFKTWDISLFSFENDITIIRKCERFILTCKWSIRGTTIKKEKKLKENWSCYDLFMVNAIFQFLNS